MKNVTDPVSVYLVTGRKTPCKPSLMIARFESVGSDPDQELICKGFSEELINHLSKVEGLLVIAPSTSLAYSSSRSVAEACEQLGVAALPARPDVPPDVHARRQHDGDSALRSRHGGQSILFAGPGGQEQGAHALLYQRVGPRSQGSARRGTPGRTQGCRSRPE